MAIIAKYSVYQGLQISKHQYFKGIFFELPNAELSLVKDGEINSKKLEVFAAFDFSDLRWRLGITNHAHYF